MMRYSTILFDLDGTLTDPVLGICRSIQYALGKAGRPVGPLEHYHKWIGPPLLRSFEVYANATPEEAQEMLRFYRERFSSVGLFENEVYPGIPALLSALKDRGARLAVATGKPTIYSRQILEHFDLMQYMDVVSGISLDKEPLDKCQVILHALYTLGETDKSRCVMVGDRAHDAIGAKMGGVDFIGVLYGYGSRDELEAEGADVIASDVTELRRILLSD
ncbi:MAG: HAD hydrolase-like protein [Oscillospiraceae bacterium]|nr:HAD hydrolase-like protein [Oscillospiraceae bacterium]